MTGPFLKWAGGKTRMLDTLLPMRPHDVDERRHVEPFLGGGAMFFSSVAQRVVLSDVNEALINTYTVVRDDLDGLIAELTDLAEENDKTKFTEHRYRFNEHKYYNMPPVERAALFIYLNKTCFNGLYRVNKAGKFNVPYGHYERPNILDKTKLICASSMLKRAEIHCGDFTKCDDVESGDFVFLDPPYAPVTETSNFVSYTKDGFFPADHKRLNDYMGELDSAGAKFMLTNSNVPFTRELYGRWNVTHVNAARSISADGNREDAKELVVRNY